MPDVPELLPQDRMAGEKETTGLYLSGHPMDEYRQMLKGANVVPIGQIMESFAENSGKFSDEQIVTVAGVIQTVRSRMTRNNTMMAYLTLEDDTGAIELLAFSSALRQYDSILRENNPVMITGKISVRDEKEPQMILNAARLLLEYDDPVLQETRQMNGETDLLLAPNQRLYLKLEDMQGRNFRKTRAILRLFPGMTQVVLVDAQTGKRYGARCGPDSAMLEELRQILGVKNVVIK